MNALLSAGAGAGGLPLRVTLVAAMLGAGHGRR